LNCRSRSESLPPTAALRAGVSLHTGPIKRKVSAQASESNSTKGPHKIPRRDHDPESQSPEILHTARVRVSSESGSSNDDAPGMGFDLVGATNKDEDIEEARDWQGK
jgi:hypothetical protein